MLDRLAVNLDAAHTPGMQQLDQFFFTVFSMIRKRETLMPPPVLPAQAPTNISRTRMVRENSGHRSKFVVA